MMAIPMSPTKKLWTWSWIAGHICIMNPTITTVTMIRRNVSNAGLRNKGCYASGVGTPVTRSPHHGPGRAVLSHLMCCST